MTQKPDALQALIDQLDSARTIAQARLDGLASPASLPEGEALTAREHSIGRLTDEEYLWEPAPGSWSVRKRGEAATSAAFGVGDWVLDNESFDPDPAPLTTIAWRLGHLHSTFAGRWEWTFGEKRTPPKELVAFSPSADTALAEFWKLIDRWQTSLESVTDDQLHTVGFGQYPQGSDPEVPFIEVIWWTNLEFIHHMAEIALLRDLWQHKVGGRSI